MFFFFCSQRCLTVYTSATQWYKRAADLGDKRATQRLKASQHGPLPAPGGPGAVLRREGAPAEGGDGKGKECVIM